MSAAVLPFLHSSAAAFSLLSRVNKSLAQSRVQLVDYIVRVNAVNGASLSDGLAARGRTAETVHSHCEKDGSGSLAVKIKNITDNGINSYFHNNTSFLY